MLNSSFWEPNMRPSLRIPIICLKNGFVFFTRLPHFTQTALRGQAGSPRSPQKIPIVHPTQASVNGGTMRMFARGETPTLIRFLKADLPVGLCTWPSIILTSRLKFRFPARSSHNANAVHAMENEMRNSRKISGPGRKPRACK